MTIDKTATTVLTPSQILRFLATAEQTDGVAASRDHAVGEILQSILFNGPIAVDIPETWVAGPVFEKLLSEELIALKSFGCSENVIREARNVYGLAFDAFRVLEEHPAHSPIISYEQAIKNQKIDKVELADLYGNIQFGRSQLSRIFDPMVSSTGDIFGYYLEESIDMFSSVARDIMDNMGLLEGKHTDWMQLTSNLGDAMGLRVRSAEELDREFPFLDFTPDDLAHLERSLDPVFAGQSFADHAYLHMQSELGVDVGKKTTISIIWKTILDMYNASRYADQIGGVLVLPTDIDCDPRPEKSRNDKDLVRIYKLYLSERYALPRLNSIEDLMRLRDDKGLGPLKENLRAWRNLGDTSDYQVVAEIRREIDLSAKKMKCAQAESQAGQMIGYLALPIGVAESFLLGMPPLSLVLGSIGFAIDRYAARRLGKLSWINFGLNETSGRQSK